MTGPSYAAHLRVYEPLAAFEGDERRVWQAQLASGRGLTRERAQAYEHRVGLEALCGLVPPVLPPPGERALVTELDGVTLVCPLRTRVRAAEALLDFADTVHDDLLASFIPGSGLVTAEKELDLWRSDHPDGRLHVQTSLWQVPIRWFLLVEPEERLLLPGTVDSAVGAEAGGTGIRTGRTLLYRTAMSRARRRAARALAVLRRTVDDGAMVQAVEDLARWLEDFHPRSVVELDYGGLVHLADDDALSGDESARDVAEALAALAAADPEKAAVAYGRVLVRMKTLQSVESVN